VLRTYTYSRKISLARHEFLTGNLAQINHLMRQYGIITTREDGTIVHNAALILVSAEGRILQRREGAVFDAVAVARYFKTLSEISAQP
jgi:cytochrome oxidase Cu insertion factor (SCO1/SenC/PrrC family)